MTRPIRVVIADDSAFIRHIIASHLTSSQQFEVVGMAEDGRQAVDLVQQLRPDVLTLDVDMPVMSGQQALESIMRDTPTPVVMVSGVSLRAAEVTLQAIQAGAVDFVLKYVPGVRINPEELRRDIISKVKAASEVQVVRTLARNPTRERLTKPSEPTNGEPTNCQPDAVRAAIRAPAVVVIGASTGGPVAIKQLLQNLPSDFAAPILVVQHIPPAFTPVLAAQLNCQLPLQARVAEGGETLEPRNVYLAPGDRHLLISSQRRLELRDGPPISGHRPSIDVTMKSAAQVLQQDVYGVLLTGMGVDGASGLQFVRWQGGTTYAQESSSCVVDGMPRAAREMNAVDHIATPQGIAEHLAREVARTIGRQLTSGLDRVGSTISQSLSPLDSVEA